LDRFVRDLESRMSVDPLLQSAAVSGWRIARLDEAARRLELELMALDAAQQEALQTMARAQIAADSYWSQANPTIGEVVVELRSPPPVSPLRMVRYLQEGHKAFR